MCDTPTDDCRIRTSAQQHGQGGYNSEIHEMSVARCRAVGKPTVTSEIPKFTSSEPRNTVMSAERNVKQPR